MLLRAIKQVAGAAVREPSRLQKAFTIEGIRKIPNYIRQQMRKARKSALNEQRVREFRSEAWAHDGNLSSRRYDSYENYLAHQRSKLGVLLSRGVPLSDLQHLDRFKRHLAVVTELTVPASVLCLAARTGSEVEAFISLGHFAVGIDLNPGPNNRYVVNGDFHALQFADDSIDCVFTNSLDHALDLAKIVTEVKRVLKPGGIFLLEVYRGYDEGKVIGEWESLHWSTAKSLAEKVSELGGFQLEAERELTAGEWPQFVLRKLKH